MTHKIGIRHEDKYLMERRVAIIPKHVKRLRSEYGLEFLVQRSEKRVFTEAEYLEAGARIVDNLDEAGVIFGVKEMPLDFFENGKTYVFFSHVIKGQPYNMPMLRKMMEKKVNLIDYEKIEDDQGRRLIFFGRFAGLAGMINSLWSLGQRWSRLGIETPFRKIRQAHTYHSLEEAMDVIRLVGEEIKESGLPDEVCPVTVGFTGYGNVSGGAQEIFGLLPHKEIKPADLAMLNPEPNESKHTLYKTVFHEKDMATPKDPEATFDLQDYYNNPDNYRGIFEQYLPHLTLLMNCMYWDDRYPRIVTKDYLEVLFSNGTPKLTVIGDITCDPDGSVECTHKGTLIEDPVFVYNPLTRKPTMGFDGEGLLVMAVDILPSELPRDASISFSNALYEFVPAIAQADYSKSFIELELPSPIKRALILHKGELTPSFRYLTNHL